MLPRNFSIFRNLLSVLFMLLVILLANPFALVAADSPGLLLAKVYSGQSELKDYWVSEKLDGVRAYWNGKQLVSRQGNVFSAPDWFISGFPATPLDGELWVGRGTFEEASGTVRQLTPDDNQWRKLRYMVFDLPIPGLTFDERLAKLRLLLAELAIPHLQPVAQFKVDNQSALMTELDRIVRAGGEGLMLHRGGAFYRAGRSDDLLKLKTYDDAEAKVIRYLPGKGKYTGMMGALLVETPAGLRFKIGTGFTDAQRAEPPPIGAMITFKHFGVTKHNVPRFASFLRIRTDIEQNAEKSPAE